MKNIIYISTVILMLIPWRVSSQVILYPPLNLEAEGIECNGYLTWDKPELPGGGTPQGLLGYYVYRNGVLDGYASGADTTWYYDLKNYLCPSSTHDYWVTANYDLAYYGNPGQQGASDPSDTAYLTIICAFTLPFSENWDQASFSFNDWTFEPDQGNWTMLTNAGNPAPTVAFKGEPALVNYDIALKARILPGSNLSTCTDIFLDFDLKLENLVNSGTEKLIVVNTVCDSPEDTIAIFDNLTGFDYTHYHYLLNESRGTSLEIKFKATGQNSANIQQWLIDNILVSFKCRPPVNLSATSSQDSVTLSWDLPICDNGTNPTLFVTGYNVYRSAEGGLPPFVKLTSAQVTAKTYTDILPGGTGPSIYNYYVTDLQNDTIVNTFLCESEPSDTVMALLTGMETSVAPVCRIIPNPGTGIFKVELPFGSESLEIVDLSGRIILEQSLQGYKGNMVEEDISGQPRGVYILTVKTKTGISRGKIVII